MWVFVSQRGTERVVEEDYVSTYLRNTMPDKQPQEIGVFLRKLQTSFAELTTLQGKICWIEETASAV